MKIWPYLTLALMLFTPLAGAEWTYVDGGEGYDRYIERETILRDGNLVRVWEVDDTDRPDQFGVQSLRSRTEYDCEARKYRIVYLSAHSDHMTNGSVIYSGQIDGEWKPVQEDTLGELSMDMACEA